jgi:hypothetical protein
MRSHAISLHRVGTATRPCNASGRPPALSRATTMGAPASQSRSTTAGGITASRNVSHRD